jgi:hypothetical protein
MLRGLVSRFFPEKGLAGVRGTARVEVEAEILGTNTTKSPLSGLGAVAFRITWVEGLAHREGSQRAGARHFSAPIATGWIGAALRLMCEGHTILVPLEGLRLGAAVDLDDATPLSSPMPPAFRYLLERKASGALYYREHAIYARDAVVLHATLRPTMRTGGYRASAREAAMADFLVEPHTGATIIDRSTGR